MTMEMILQFHNSDNGLHANVFRDHIGMYVVSMIDRHTGETMIQARRTKADAEDLAIEFCTNPPMECRS